MLLSKEVEASGIDFRPVDSSSLFNCGCLLKMVLNSHSQSVADALPVVSRVAREESYSTDVYANTETLNDIWHCYCANAGVKAPALTSLILRYNACIWRHSSLPLKSNASEASVTGAISAGDDPPPSFLATLLCSDFFPALIRVDISHSFSRKPLRSLTQVEKLIAELHRALCGRVHRRIQAQADATDAVTEAAHGPLTQREVVHIYIHGLQSVVTGSSNGSSSGVGAVLTDRSRAVKEQLESFLKDAASVAHVHVGGSLAVL